MKNYPESPSRETMAGVCFFCGKEGKRLFISYKPDEINDTPWTIYCGSCDKQLKTGVAKLRKLNSTTWAWGPVTVKKRDGGRAFGIWYQVVYGQDSREVDTLAEAKEEVVMMYLGGLTK